MLSIVHGVANLTEHWLIGRVQYLLADVQVARTRDFGNNDTIFYIRTHLGSYLNAGDYALGYDLTSQNFNEADLSGLRGRQVPDVVRYHT